MSLLMRDEANTPAVSSEYHLTLLTYFLTSLLLGHIASMDFKAVAYCYRCGLVCVSTCVSVGRSHELC